MSVYRVRVRDLILDGRRKAIFKGTATETLAWLVGRGMKSGEELFVEYHSKKKWQEDSWAPVLNNLQRMAELES